MPNAIKSRLIHLRRLSFTQPFDVRVDKSVYLFAYRQVSPLIAFTLQYISFAFLVISMHTTLLSELQYSAQPRVRVSL